MNNNEFNEWIDYVLFDNKPTKKLEHLLEFMDNDNDKLNIYIDYLLRENIEEVLFNNNIENIKHLKDLFNSIHDIYERLYTLYDDSFFRVEYHKILYKLFPTEENRSFCDAMIEDEQNQHTQNI